MFGVAGDFVKACCVIPPAGAHKAYLTPLAVLTSASAFQDALKALTAAAAAAARAGDTVGGNSTYVYGDTPAVVAKHVVRIERASMAANYVMLWRWDEFDQYARNHSLPWPIQPTKQAAFDDFARIFNRTGSEHVVCGHGGTACMHACIHSIGTKARGGATFSSVCAVSMYLLPFQAFFTLSHTECINNLAFVVWMPGRQPERCSESALAQSLHHGTRQVLRPRHGLPTSPVNGDAARLCDRGTVTDGGTCTMSVHTFVQSFNTMVPSYLVPGVQGFFISFVSEYLIAMIRNQN